MDGNKDCRRISRGGARLFGNALNMIRNQSHGTNSIADKNRADDYSLPISLTSHSTLHSYENDIRSSNSDTSEYTLPLLGSECISTSLISSNSSTSSGSFSQPPSYEGYGTRGSLGKRTPKKSDILRDRNQASGVCLSCEEEEQFHSSHKLSTGKSVLPSYNTERILTMKSRNTFIDAHCHLDFLFQREKYKGTYSMYQKKHRSSFPATYEGCVAVFCNPFTFDKKPMWEKFLVEKNVWAAFGCHPHNSKDFSFQHEKFLQAALDHPKVRALGEIGLDYSRRNNCQKTVQHKVFRRQLSIALARELPLVIHCREAHEDAMQIMKEILPLDYKIHLHCFTDVWEYAQKWLNAFPNLYIGITNLVTFDSAKCVHKVAKNIPLDRLLLETDAPYFVPKVSPKGTRFSHPGMAIHVAAQIAGLRDTSLEEVLYWTRRNTNSVYGV